MTAPVMPELRSLYLYISGGCNLKCGHCWISPEHDPSAATGRYLDAELAFSAADQALPLGLSAVKLTGGEPMLHPGFARILSGLSERGLEISMETNGTLIDAEAADLLGSTRGVSHVSVSLDGAVAETHDTLRGIAGSFAAAVAGVSRLVSRGIRPQLICTLHAGNLPEVPGVIELAAGLGCSTVKFNNVQLLGRGSSMGRLPREILLDVFERFRRHPSVGVLFDVPPAFLPPGALLRQGARSCRLLNILGILPDGSMAMCGIGTAVPGLVYGRLQEDSVEDVWRNSPGLRELRRVIPVGLQEPCAGCVHRDACLGVCAAGNYHRTGRLDASFWFCEEAYRAGSFPESRRTGSAAVAGG